MNDSVPGVDYTPPPEHPDVYTPLSREQLDMIHGILLNEDGGDALHASILLLAASYPEVVFSPEDNTDADIAGVAAIRALRRPAYLDLDAALHRIDRAVASETDPCHERLRAGHDDGKTALRSLGLRLLEIGFPVAKAGGADRAQAAVGKEDAR